MRFTWNSWPPSMTWYQPQGRWMRAGACLDTSFAAQGVDDALHLRTSTPVALPGSRPGWRRLPDSDTPRREVSGPSVDTSSRRHRRAQRRHDERRRNRPARRRTTADSSCQCRTIRTIAARPRHTGSLEHRIVDRLRPSSAEGFRMECQCAGFVGGSFDRASDRLHGFRIDTGVLFSQCARREEKISGVPQEAGKNTATAAAASGFSANRRTARASPCICDSGPM